MPLETPTILPLGEPNELKNLQAYSPQGKFLIQNSVEGSVLNSYFKMLATQQNEFVRHLNNTYIAADLTKTTQLLEEYENALGIPDDIFTKSGGIASRTVDVLVRLFLMKDANTKQQWLDIAFVYGISVEITNPQPHLIRVDVIDLGFAEGDKLGIDDFPFTLASAVDNQNTLFNIYAALTPAQDILEFVFVDATIKYSPYEP